ncbi:Cuticle-degrading protease [Metarhizium brunneum]|uniref:Cuticle-degrading protease n=1 Tax=Metarhizium brunneum TaxID=500148 RepID=A0A7D5YXG8_9HYPO
MIPSALLLLLPMTAAAPASKRAEPAPLIVPRDDSGVFHGQYTVILKDDSDSQALTNVMELIPGNASQVYGNLFKGFTAELDEASLGALRDHPAVDFVEMDQKVSLPDEPQGKVDAVEADPNATAPVVGPQSPVPSHPDQVFRRYNGLTQYLNNPNGGEGVCAYVVDSGVDVTHPEFGGRAHMVKSTVDWHGQDWVGHGTHVAGILGSNSYGVAKRVTIYGIKALSERPDASGISNMIAGLDYVAQDAPHRHCPNGIVVNLSAGIAERIYALNRAARGLVERGYFVAVAAGNEGHDARFNSPASEPSICTVGDYRYRDSNFGPAVDIQAPAVNVLSTVPGGRIYRLTGTSMASPFIAGLAASIASAHHQRAGPDLCAWMVQRATPQ